VHVDHRVQRTELEPWSVDVVTVYARGHDEAQREGRKAAYASITLHRFQELLRLFDGLCLEQRILDVELFVALGVRHVVQVGLEGVLHLVDDLLEQLFVRSVVIRFRLVPRDVSEDRLCEFRSVLLLYFGWRGRMAVIGADFDGRARDSPLS
jgi:hypothetical protein